ncbi:hypothetical protein J6590_013888 [Homalodisca vitripennis]|nr:hypothetical protein J6590_013888 [Homalodisca vitripennis]
MHIEPALLACHQLSEPDPSTADGWPNIRRFCTDLSDFKDSNTSLIRFYRLVRHRRSVDYDFSRTCPRGFYGIAEQKFVNNRINLSLHSRNAHKPAASGVTGYSGWVYQGVGAASCQDSRGRIRTLISNSYPPGRRGGQLLTNLSNQSRGWHIFVEASKNLLLRNEPHQLQQSSPAVD